MKAYTFKYDSPIGLLTAASDGERLTGLWMEHQRYIPAVEEIPGRGLEIFRKTGDWLDRYFAGEGPSGFELPLAPEGSEFRLTVWSLLRNVPYGSTTSYSALAKETAIAMGKERMSARAVGGAVGHNPISIVIPCHRVIGADGSLTGFGGGLETKRFLLSLEGSL